MQGKFLRGIFDSVRQGVLVVGPDEKILAANQAFRQITGYDEEEIVGRNCTFLQGRGTSVETRNQIREALATHADFEGKILNYRKDGSPFWNELSITSHMDSDGSLLGYVGITRDVSDQQAQIERIEKLEREFRLIFDNLQAGVVVLRPDRTVERINPEARRLLGLPVSLAVDEMTFDSLRAVEEDGSPLDVDEYPAWSIFTTGEEMRDVVIGIPIRDSDEFRWLSCTLSPLLEEGVGHSRVLISFNDISQVKRLQLEAERDRQRFDLASRATKGIVFDWDLTTGAFWTNENFAETFGIAPPDKLDLEDAPTYVIEEEREAYRQDLHRAIAAGECRHQREFHFALPDGDLGTGRSDFLIYYDEDGSPVRIVGTKTDLTEIRGKESQLRASEERLRIVATLASDVIWEHNVQTDEVWRADDWTERLRLDPTLAPATRSDWFALVVPEERQRVTASFNAALEGDAAEWFEEYRVFGGDGKPILIENRAAIIRDAEGVATRLVGAARDITEQRQVELAVQEGKALNALGKLTGGVAHDFNNLLMVILGNTEILGDLITDPEALELLELIESAALNGSELTSRLLSFARQQPLAPRTLDVASQIAEATSLIRHGLPENIALEVVVEEQDLYAEVDQGQFANALINLAINSRDAMPDGGDLRIEATSCVVADPDAAENPDLPEGRYVRIRLIDNGVGMDSDTARQAFEPFFTTKPVGHGTGLGLSMVYGFAKQSGGDAKIESVPGQGTTVEIFLPQSAHIESAAEIGPIQKLDAAAPSSTVLVVEDEEQVRIYVERLLRDMGYSVLSAENAEAALEVIGQHEGIDMLVTDLVMPGGMDGLQLAEEARRLLPGIKVLLTSGLASRRALKDGFDGPHDTILSKPYTRKQLAAAIARARLAEISDDDGRGSTGD